jgi:mono/diheme cytochrome c family protein
MRHVTFLLVSAAMVSAAQAQPDGRAIFNQQCVVCHQADAKGVPGNFPPLAGNADLLLARDFPARVVLFGMNGKIVVKGQIVEGAMPPLGDVLNDDEIATVVNFVRGHFGNAALAPKTVTPLDAATIAALRASKQGEDVHAYRDELLAHQAN